MTDTLKRWVAERRRIAEAATPGPWEYEGNTGADYYCKECGEPFDESGYAVKSKDKYQVLECHLYGMERFAKPDGLFIADTRNCMSIHLALLELLGNALEKIIRVDGSETLYPQGPSIAREALDQVEALLKERE